MIKRTDVRPLCSLLAALLCWILSTSEVSAYDLEKRIQTATLENGLKILIVERHLSPTVSCYIRYRVGAVDEPTGMSGIAHFMEHMMFKGTKTLGTLNYAKETKIIEKIQKKGELLDRERRKGRLADSKRLLELTADLRNLQKRHKRLIIENEIDRLYRENGGINLNATTGRDFTSYFVSLPANRIELWARIESDRMQNTVFREFYSERDVIIEERRQRVESDPEGLLFERFLAEAFTAHPYRRPVLGLPDEQRYLEIASMRSFYKKYYKPNNTIIVVVGDVEAQRVVELIKRYFAPIPRWRINRPSIISEPRQNSEKRIDVFFDARPMIVIGFHKPTVPAFDDYVFDVIDCLLTKGRASRLYRELVDRKKIAESVETNNGFPANRYANLFTVWAALREPYRFSEIEATIYEELGRLQNETVTDREMERVRNQLRSDFIRGIDSNEGIASILSYYAALTDDTSYVTNYLSMIDKITAADIMRVARQYLRAENRTVATLSSSKLSLIRSSQAPLPDKHRNDQGKDAQGNNP